MKSKRSFAKKVPRITLLIALVLMAGYGSYKLYNLVLEDAIKKIQCGVSKGVSKGIGKSIRTIINPFKWFK